MMKTAKGATSGLFAGTVWGTIVATWYDVPRVERSVALPGLVRTAKLMGNYGLTFVAISGIYIGVNQMVEKDRMKKDFINIAVGRFVACASVLGFKAKACKDGLESNSFAVCFCLSCWLLSPIRN